ncbi:hypothetical protein [Marivita sp. GX14005]|uniref:hypothetical protein n=1 Tax=Marivita sp. GX14005 TaxID=2942276 RepID=UPI002018F82E|nr:hypothetical protein [Marivita sp. GX14005]MCL3883313.1 hypothetical protein [Marivita sp. GX14005]
METFDPDMAAADLARIKRAAQRIGKAEWQTLFRQLRDAATALATHPFLAGDIEAERRLVEALSADDLEEMNLRLDRLAEYVDAKLAFHAELTGEAPPPSVQRPVSGRRGAGGPSGDDFAIAGDKDAPRLARRDVLRL